MPVEEILNKFQGAKYLSSVDLRSGYWQCLLNKSSRELTAFLHGSRNYQFQVLPFGLITSVAEFQRILDRVLGPEILQYTLVYVDDIHVASATFQEHMEHLEHIFQKFREFNVTVNRNKL